MGGISISDRTGTTIIGVHGKYRVGKWLGSGGNGAVYEADVIEDDGQLPNKTKYAVKFLEARREAARNTKELEKRKRRFVKEIKEVLGFQAQVVGIVPIYDTSVSLEQEPGELWYIMPMAEMYNPGKYSVLEKLEQVRRIGICISQLHRMGFAHRDIKPGNLLMLEGQLCLSDFGLIWNTNDKDAHITEVNDRIGPQPIRPPELRSIAEVDSVDYRKSDVYLYAKTLWMILKRNKQGFEGEYDRRTDAYLDRKSLKIDTAEPLHCLMERATKNKWNERIDIEDCLEYIESQLKVMKGEIHPSVLNDYMYSEQITHNILTIPCDEMKYSETGHVFQILESMAGKAGLVFTEPGREYPCLPLRKSRLIQGNIFEMEVYNPCKDNRKKQIIVDVEYVSIKGGETYYTLGSVKHSYREDSVRVFSSIEAALWDESRRGILNAAYQIRLEKLSG